MGIIKNSEILREFTDNDLYEYRNVCKKFKGTAQIFEENLIKLGLEKEFYIDYAFNTSESGFFYNIRAKYFIKKKFMKKKVYFTIIDVMKITRDEYLDLMIKAKEYLENEE